MKITICPFCENEIDEEFPSCCGEWGHTEELHVCDKCEETLIEGECPTCGSPGPGLC